MGDTPNNSKSICGKERSVVFTRIVARWDMHSYMVTLWKTAAKT